jgi:dynein heavy chain 1
MASPEPSLQAAANGTNGTEQINGNGVHDTNFDTSVFRQYLLALLPPVLGAAPDELEETLFDSDFDDRVTKFAAEGGGVIYVVKVKHDLGGERLTHVCMTKVAYINL